MQHRSRPLTLPGSDEATATGTRDDGAKPGTDQEAGWRPFLILFVITFFTCVAVYLVLSPFFAASSSLRSSAGVKLDETDVSQCCRGASHLEFWGQVVQSGDANLFNTSAECCKACKAMCSGDGPCLCNSWVYCSDYGKCGSMFGECWLKKQENPLSPEVRDSSSNSMWTSGLVFGKDVGIVALETKYGTVRIKLLPECAPNSVAYILDRMKNVGCEGSHYYRAESRGNIWDESGNRLDKKRTGPPYGLIQGTMETRCSHFTEIETEACPYIRRGSVGWIGNGPDFFISLANHDELYPKYTVFAQVVPADMPFIEKLVTLPRISSVWEGLTVSMLNQSISIQLKKV